MSIEFMPQRDAATGRKERPDNNMLRRLRDDDYALLAPHLEVRARPLGELLYNPGDNVEQVYFPCGPSLVSYLVCNEDGRDVETVLVGREGAIGGIVSLGHLPAYCRMVVKNAGAFATLRTAQLEAAKTQSGTLRHLFARYADCLLAQIFQSTACNAIHSIEQRAAKWILAAIERTGEPRVPMTHEQLATMLGVGRSYTSRVLQNFRAEGILDTRRGALVVRDAAALATRACACNEAVKAHFDTVLQGIYPSEPLAAVAVG
ncbi:MAG: Crp/Fnr family transcriptional regulator [Xanthobacteraceae bacterium]|nr:Crp/Fnr family transcriptional regulator [Xanthobacteraceae bacterium]